MWPFKRRPETTWEEISAALPDVPCGGKATHYEWEKGMGMPCPRCAGMQRHAEKMADEARMANLIADAIVAKLAARTTQQEPTR